MNELIMTIAIHLRSTAPAYTSIRRHAMQRMWCYGFKLLHITKYIPVPRELRFLSTCYLRVLFFDIKKAVIRISNSLRLKTTIANINLKRQECMLICLKFHVYEYIVFG